MKDIHSFVRPFINSFINSFNEGMNSLNEGMNEGMKERMNERRKQIKYFISHSNACNISNIKCDISIDLLASMNLIIIRGSGYLVPEKIS